MECRSHVHRIRRHLALGPTLVAIGFLGGACTPYRPAPLDPAAPLRAAGPAPVPLTYEDAVRWSLSHNPELLALADRAHAVNLRPAGEPVELGGGVDEDGRWSVDLSAEALSLLGLGTRGAERSLARAARCEAVLRHHERARVIAAELAEAYAIEAAFATMTEPEYRVDASAFVRAGLETGAAEAATAATAAEWTAEAATREAERATNRSAIGRLLGIARGTPPQLRLPDASWPVVPEATPEAVIAARADVARLVAAFETADAELRRAVAAQYPGLLVEPGLALDPTSLFGALRLRIPVGAAAGVRSAEAAREAARHEAEAGVLLALDEARQTRARHRETVALLAAAHVRLDASRQLLASTRMRLETSTGSVIEAVFAADAVVAAARGHREAVIAEARARVRAAASTGWPTSSP